MTNLALAGRSRRRWQRIPTGWPGAQETCKRQTFSRFRPAATSVWTHRPSVRGYSNKPSARQKHRFGLAITSDSSMAAPKMTSAAPWGPQGRQAGATLARTGPGARSGTPTATGRPSPQAGDGGQERRPENGRLKTGPESRPRCPPPCPLSANPCGSRLRAGAAAGCRNPRKAGESRDSSAACRRNNRAWPANAPSTTALRCAVR